MNFKTTYTLFGILLVFLLVFALTQMLGIQRSKDDGTYVLPSMNDRRTPLRSEDIETVALERPGQKPEKLVFYRSEQGWKLRQPDVRVEAHMVDRLIDQVKGLRKEEKADLSNDLAFFGLDTPTTTVTLTKKGAEREWKLKLGKESPGGSKAVVYVHSSDQKTPLAVKKGDVDTLAKSINDFRSKDLISASALNTSYASIQDAGKDPLILEKTSDSHWRFQKPAYGEADYEGESPPPGAPRDQKNISGVRELLESVGGIRVADSLNDFVAEDVNDKDLAEKYGLETGKPARLRIEVKRTPSGNLLGGEDKKPPVTEALLIGKKVEEAADKKDGKSEPAGSKEEQYYARLENERSVVKIGAKSVEPLIKVAERPDVLRNRDLVQVDAGKTDAIDIKNDNGLLKLRRADSGPVWKLYAGSEKGRAADDQPVQDVLTALNAKRQIKSFPEAAKTDAELGLDKPSAEVSVWVEGVQKESGKDEPKKDESKDKKPEEKKDPDAEPKLKSDKPTVRLVFGKKENDVVYVRREIGDDKTRFGVPATLLEKLAAGPLAFLDRTLPSFPAEDVTKLVLVRDGQTLEIEKEKKDDKSPASWTFKLPKEMVGRTADIRNVEEILSELQGLRAEKLVSEKPSDGDLDKFGLKSPAYMVTLTLMNRDKKSEERVYSIGKEGGDKGNRYAKQGERDVVFLVRPQTVTTLQAELQDPTVFRFDPAKLQAIKLQGWEKIYTFQVALELQRKSGEAKGWVVKSGPPGFQLDEKKVESFVNELAHLKAERFLKTEPKPEHKLGKGERALEIELTIDGEKSPITLTLGGLDEKDKKSYFAQSSTVPGDVFHVPQDRFQTLLKDGAKFFSKDAPAAE